MRSEPRYVQGPTLFVRLLGGVELRLGDERLPPLESARAESVLAYLLLHRDAPQARQRLAFLLWPDSSESQALTNLRQVLFNLRRALPGADRYIEVGRRSLQWRSDAPLWLDVAVFEHAIVEGRLEAAVALYGGDLLEASYDDWVVDERERLRQLYLGAVERVAAHAEAEGRWSDAIRYGERLLRGDPLREEAYRLLMRGYRASGDRARARGGGHAVAGHAVCDRGLMIDLSLMKAIGVDPEARTTRVSGGVLWGELDRATQRFALATTGGMISHTGIAGLTLGGGLGNLMRKLGLTVDSLRSVDLVTAEGEPLHVSEETDAELFWGLRGGGGDFGIATSFEYRLHPVGPMVLGGPMLWPLADAPAVLRLLRDFSADAPDDLGIALFTRLAPPMPFIPSDRYGKPALMVLVLWTGDPAEGQQVIAPLRNVGSPLADVVTIMPYVALQSLGDTGAPHGNHYYWKSHRLPSLYDEVIDVLVDALGKITSPFSQIGGWLIGGAASRVDPSATAVGEREVGVELKRHRCLAALRRWRSPPRLGARS